MLSGEATNSKFTARALTTFNHIRGKHNNHYTTYGWFMVFNATINNISVLSWQSVLLMEKTGVPRDKLYNIVVSSTPTSHEQFPDHSSGTSFRRL